MTSNIEWINWLLMHQWVFWIVINLGAILAWRLATHLDGIGILGLIFPSTTCITTVILASPWYLGYIGIATLLVCIFPYIWIQYDP